MWEFMVEYARLAYRDVGGVKFTVEMTTKRNKKAKSGDPDYDNLYTMYILDKNDKVVMTSIEQAGYNKNHWDGVKFARFVHSLKKIE